MGQFVENCIVSYGYFDFCCKFCFALIFRRPRYPSSHTIRYSTAFQETIFDYFLNVTPPNYRSPNWEVDDVRRKKFNKERRRAKRKIGNNIASKQEQSQFFFYKFILLTICIFFKSLDLCILLKTASPLICRQNQNPLPYQSSFRFTAKLILLPLKAGNRFNGFQFSINLWQVHPYEEVSGSQLKCIEPFPDARGKTGILFSKNIRKGAWWGLETSGERKRKTQNGNGIVRHLKYKCLQFEILFFILY